jgi:hypothetical protein
MHFPVVASLCLFPMGQIPSRLRSLPELFAFPSRQICASDCFSRPCRSSDRNSDVVFSSPTATDSLNTRRVDNADGIIYQEDW